jgi:hypothetical protein
MAAGDVSLGHDEIAASESFYVRAYAMNDAHKFMADDHWHRNRFLRPDIPLVYVHVRPAD